MTVIGLEHCRVGGVIVGHQHPMVIAPTFDLHLLSDIDWDPCLDLID